MNNGQGRVRIVLRAIRLPPSVTEERRAILPTEMWWPEQDHGGAHACIDAVLSADIGTMRGWKETWPDNVFGFERYIEWLERKAAGMRAGRPDLGGPGKLTPIQLTKFPAQVTSTDRVNAVDLDNGVRVTTSVVRFADGQSALRITLYGTPALMGLDEGQPVRLSRAYVDVVTGQFDIIEHFPGRYAAMGLSPQLVQDVLGVRRFDMKRRVRGSDRPHAVELPLKSPLARQVESRAAAPAREAAAEVFFDAFPKAPKERVSTLVQPAD